MRRGGGKGEEEMEETEGAGGAAGGGQVMRIGIAILSRHVFTFSVGHRLIWRIKLTARDLLTRDCDSGR